MNKKNLAIIIPAFKDTYLRETLNSLYFQTNQNFKVYIGDDNSPFDLYSIVNEFIGKIDIIYKRFNDNLGGYNLVNHWKRCVEMSKNEEWIWLFSDDDILQPNCVKLFYNSVLSNPGVELFHFNVNVIDGKGFELIDYKKRSFFPEIISSVYFFEARINHSLNSYIVEYVFSRNLYQSQGGFVNFDLAWCADDATWIKYGNINGIHTIYGNHVIWRYSGINISSIKNDINISYRKINSKLIYLKWVDLFFKSNNLKHSLNKFTLIKWLTSDIRHNDNISFFIKSKVIYSYSRKITNKTFSIIYTIELITKELIILIKKNVFNKKQII